MSPRGLQRRDRLSRKRAYVRAYKVLRGCRDCGNSRIRDLCDPSGLLMADHASVLEFDHIPGRGDKVGNISDLVSRDAAWSSIVAEVRKCAVVCGICHALRTVSRSRGIVEPGRRRK